MSRRQGQRWGWILSLQLNSDRLEQPEVDVQVYTSSGLLCVTVGLHIAHYVKYKRSAYLIIPVNTSTNKYRLHIASAMCVGHPLHSALHHPLHGALHHPLHGALHHTVPCDKGVHATIYYSRKACYRTSWQIPCRTAIVQVYRILR